MPIYEYGCTKCGTFELNQRITDSPLRRCPKCRGKVTKLISQTSFQLKGSGWYVTDYASKENGKKDAKEGKTDTAKAESKSAETSKPAEAKASSPKDSSSGKTEATAA